jgi:predicted Zn-dependent protease
VIHHPSEVAIRQVGWRVVLAAALGDASAIPQIAGRLSTGLLEQSYSREAEAEADRMAVAMLNKAGIDSRGIIDVFEALQEQRTGALPEWLSSHPALADRIEAVRPRVRSGESAMTGDEWQAVRTMCD